MLLAGATMMLAAAPTIASAQGKSGRAQKAEQKVEQKQKHADAHHASQAPSGTHHDVRATGPAKRPAGWDRGKKTGWKGGSLPPGQAKKRRSTVAYDANGRRRTTTTTTTTTARKPVLVRKPTSTTRTTTTTAATSTSGMSTWEKVKAADAAATRTP
jgi:hypothetical protein